LSAILEGGTIFLPLLEGQDLRNSGRNESPLCPLLSPQKKLKKKKVLEGIQIRWRSDTEVFELRATCLQANHCTI
jgi:hypothetical protein